MSAESQEQPKIIVDDDWKTRAQEEKEELEKKQQEKRESQPDSGEGEGIPPASFTTMVSMLATQALTALGRIPDPVEKKYLPRLDLAKYHIDMLGVLESKTKNNLTKEEEQMLTQLLHELRMDFMAGGYKPPAEDPPKPSIDLGST